MSDLDNVLVNVTRFRDLLVQEGQLEELESLIVDSAGRYVVDDKAFRVTTGGTESTTTTTPEQFVSLGLTWSKLKRSLSRGGQMIIWMGEDTYLHMFFPDSPYFEFLPTPRGFQRLFKVWVNDPHKVSVDDSHFLLNIFSMNRASISYGCMMNLLAEIISLDASITEFTLRSFGDPIMQCPSAALERFITKGASKRRLYFHDYASRYRISSEQSRILFSGSCCDNVCLRLDFFEIFEDGGATLIEALRSNHCPSKLSFCNIESMQETRFVDFIDGMINNESLKEIDVSDLRWSSPRIPVLLRALLGKRGLCSLSLPTLNFWPCDLGNDLWRQFWSLMAKNQSITHLSFLVDYQRYPGRNFTYDEKVHHSNCIAEVLTRNTTLTDFAYTKAHHARHHDPRIMREVVLPKLELNRSRPRIQAIRQVPDDRVRCWLVAKALMHPTVQNYASIRFLLLSVNSDLASFWSKTKKHGRKSRLLHVDGDVIEKRRTSKRQSRHQKKN